MKMMNSHCYHNFIRCCRIEKNEFNDDLMVMDQDALTLKPKLRNEMCHQIAETIEIKASDEVAIASYAHQGMSLGVVISQILTIPFLYLRTSQKKYGLKNQVEGLLLENQKIIFFSLYLPSIELFDKTNAIFQEKKAKMIQWVSIIGKENDAKNLKIPHHFFLKQEKIYGDLKLMER